MTALGRILPRLLLLLGLAAAAPLARAEEDVRFSATLTPAQRAAAGLDQLTPDNVAVIDGLVRQDAAASRFKNNPVEGTRFSQRRTAREREIAGLDRLAAAQLAELDERVRRQLAGPAPEPGATAALTSAAAASSGGVQAVAYKRPLELHGEVSYTVGWSKAGSFQGGDLVVSYDDPEHRYSILVGYSEYHGKGLPPWFLPGAGPGRACVNPPLLAP